MFYETMEDVLPDMKVIIESDSGSIETIMPIDAFSGNDTKKASVAAAADE
ncbi:MAG: hypothetical protein BWY61_01895 [Firmicutes bacterium ADurb.Bin354]|nr:MAG: hypothetical protein BWY61_01895 [Firmicutes bacterium ADurb.Bin354]